MKKTQPNLLSHSHTTVVTSTVVANTVVPSVVGSGVVGISVLGSMVVVVTITEPHRTAGRRRSSQVGSLGWKQYVPSSLVYIPKQTGIVCQSLQYDP